VSERARLSTMPFIDPQRDPSRQHVEIKAPRPEPLPRALRPLRAEIAGAGRSRDLETWVAETHTTALLVHDGELGSGTVVHEWYADGVTPESLLLGASMTKSVLAHLVGRAARAGNLHLDDAVVEHVPGLADSGYAGCTVEHVLTMTTGVAWVEDHRDPTGPASRLIVCFAGDGGDSRALLTQVPRQRPGRRRHGRVRGGLAAAGRASAHRQVVRRSGARPGVGAALVHPRWPWLQPARLPSSITTHAGIGYHWWPLDTQGVRVTSDGSRGQFGYVDHELGVTVLKTSQWPHDDVLVDRQQRDLSYLGLPLVAAAARKRP
jgi:CubicO group peptidase (beta-lactamase class C family)